MKLIMKYSIAYTVIGVLIGIFVAQSAIAQSPGESDVPRTISYQGMVSSATGARFPSGDYAVTVRLYADEHGREVLWEGKYTTTVENGLLNLELGSGDYPLPEASAMDRSLWIGIQVGEGPEMTPRTRLSAVPYALTVPDGSVTSDKLGVDYVSSIMIDGEKVTRKGSSLNITGGEGVDLRYDRLRGSMQIDLRRSGEDQGTKGDGEEGRSTQAANSTVYWSETGNNSTTPGTNYVGTSDAEELEIHVNSGNTTANAGDKRVMLYDPQPNSPNLIGGYQGNLPDTGSAIEGATIGGGGKNNRVNEVKDDYGTIGGGAGNIAGGLDTTSRTDDQYATVGGGRENEAQAEYSTVGGGRKNEAQAEYSTVGGGRENEAQAEYSTVGGGYQNEAQANYSTVGGGYQNEAQANYSTVGGGYQNEAQANYSTVGGGYYNDAQEYYSTVGGGSYNKAQEYYSTVGGGYQNEAREYSSTVGGGYQNEAQAEYSTVGGGRLNEAQEQYSTVGGGRENEAQEQYSSVGGGYQNEAQEQYSSVGGGRFNQAQASYSTVGGGYYNQAQASYTTVGGGYWNEARASSSTVGGGYWNEAQASYSTVGGGYYNETQASYSTVGGGYYNQAQGTASAIPGGRYLRVGSHSFGYNGYNVTSSPSTTDLSSFSNIAYLGNVDLWIGNVDNTPRQLRFYVGNNGNFTYSGSTAPLYVGFKAPQSLDSTRTTSTLYTLPTDFPSANGALLSSSTTGTLSWSTPSQDWSLTGNSGTTPLSSGTGHYLGTSDTTDLVIATSGTERIGIASTGEVTVAEGLTVNGNVDATNGLDVTNDSLTVGGTKFTVDEATGNTDIDGTLTVDGATTLSGNVDAQSGLDVTGSDLTVGGTKFTVAQATGNTDIDGTLTVDGATTLSGNVDAQGGLDVTGSDLTVGGTKFTVDDATGNTDIEGTLTVDGGATVTAGGLEVSAGGAAITGNSSVTGAFNLADTASALLLGDGSNNAGTSGQVLVSKGGGATPEWGDISSAAWDLSGNEATTPGTGDGENYLGTTDQRDLVIATNAIEAIRIGNSASAAGSVTIANGLTVSAGGASVTGDFELAGDLEVSEDVLVKGDLEVSEDVLVKKDLEVLEDVSVRGSFNLAETASALLLNNSAGTSGQVLLSRGGGATPEWGDMSSASAAWDLSGNEATTPGTGEGENYLGTSDTTDLVIATSGTERIGIASTGEVTVAEGLTVSGNVDAQSGLDVTGSDLTVGGTKFTVDDATGNTDIDGTLTVDGNTTLGDDNTADTVTVNGRLSQTGTQQVRFSGNVDAQSGLDVTGEDLTVGGTKFTVAQATGNTDIDGTLTVDGATTLSGNVDAQGGLDVTGSDLTVGGTKFTVAQATGNTAIDGTLTVDGATTLSGNVDAQGGLDVTGSDLTVGGTKFTVSDATGNTDIDGTLTVDGGATVTAGGLEVSAGGAAITGNSSVTGSFNLADTASALLLGDGSNNAGTSGQVLVSKGGGATPEWGDISSAAWDLSGNEATTPGTGDGENYLGTTDRRDLVIATNAIEAIRIGNSASAAGSVTIANGLTVSAGGASVTGDFELAGDLEVSEDVLVTGDLEVSEDVLVKKDLEVLEDVSVRGSFNLAETASALLLNNSAGTSGQVLLSRGGGATPEWGDMSSASAAWDLSGNEATTPGTGEGENYLGTSDAKNLVIATSGTERIEIASTGEVTVAEGLTVSGNVDAQSGLDVTGSDLTVGGTKFRVDDATGNTDIDGTLTVDTVDGDVTFNGNVDAQSGLDVTGSDLTVGGTKFTVAQATGNTAIEGTLAVDGNTTLGDDNTADAVTVNGGLSQTGTQQVRFAGNVDAQSGLDVTGSDLTVGGTKFTVAQATGNTAIEGTLTVDGATTLSGNVDAQSGLDVTGSDLTVGTNFTVDEGTGNTSIGGTLTVDTVDGDVTFNGNVDATNGLDVTGSDLTVGGTKFRVDDATGNTAIDGTLAVDTVDGDVTFNGNVDATNGLDVTGSDLTVGGTKFRVDDATGNTAIDGTLAVDTVDGDVTFNGNVDATNGLDVTGSDLTVGGTKFTVDEGTGNTSIGGTLTVDSGATVSAGGLEVSAGGAAITGNSSVTGAFNLAETASALLLNNSAGTSGQVLLSRGGGATPEWGNISSASAAWDLSGNSGTAPGTNYVGTSDAEELEIHVNSGNTTANAGDKRVMLYDPQPNSPNLIGGFQGNLPGRGTAIEGGTIGGGGKNNGVNEVKDNYGTIGGGSGNVAGGLGTTSTTDDTYATVGGGRDNQARAQYSTVGGGEGNQAQGYISTVGGGFNNQAQGEVSTVGGGRGNEAQASYSTVGGGASNHAQASYSTVGGGLGNQAPGIASAIPGGRYLTVGDNSFGFNGDSATTPTQTDISAHNQTAYFGNVDLWIGNVDSVPRELRFYVSNNGNFTYSGSTAPLYVGFKAPQALASTRTTSTLYTLPTDFPSANGALLSSSTAGTLSWSTSIGVDTDGDVGIGTNAPDVSLDVDGGFAIRPPAEIEITSDNTTVTPGDRSFLQIDSDNIPASRTIILADGKEGQILVIQCTATGFNGIELLTSASTHTFTANKRLENQDNLYLIWDEANSTWLEIGHTDF